jgi:mannosyltransferase
MTTTTGLTQASQRQAFRLRAALRAPSVAVPAGAGILAVLITALGSWIPSLWGDEAASALSAQRSLPSFLHEVTHVDAVHAVYYAALHVWVTLAGTSPFALRFPSAIATGVMVAGVVVLARLFAREWRLPLIAAAVAIALPRLNFAGIEARGYAWTAAVATWIIVVGVATLSGRLEARVGWTLFALLCGAGTALNVFVGSTMVVIGCLAALRPESERRTQLRRWAAACGVAVLLASPVLVFAAFEHGQVAFLAKRPVPPHAWLVSQWFGYSLFAVLGWVAMLAAVGLIALRRHPRLDRGLGLAALLWAGLPSAFLIGTIPVLHNYTARYLTFTAPAAALLIALAVDAAFRSWKPAGIAALAAVLLAAAPMYVAQRTPYAENESDWAEVGAVIADHAHPGDQVAFDATVRPSRRPESSWRVYPADFRGVSVPQLVTPYWEAHTWTDKLMTIEDAAAQHLFTADTVFAVEADYPDEGVVDVRGVPSLEGAGYRVVRRWTLHSDLVVQLDRAGAPQG